MQYKKLQFPFVAPIDMSCEKQAVERSKGFLINVMKGVVKGYYYPKFYDVVYPSPEFQFWVGEINLWGEFEKVLSDFVKDQIDVLKKKTKFYYAYGVRPDELGRASLEFYSKLHPRKAKTMIEEYDQIFA